MKDVVLMFDCFGVVLSNISRDWFQKHGNNPYFIERCNEYYNLIDRGQISFNTMLDLLYELSDESQEDILNFWNTNVKLNEELVEYIRKLKEKYHIILVSNASSEYLRPVLLRFGLYDLFEEVLISSELRVAKPDKAIFEIAKSKIYADKYIFIDDNIKNIKAASKLDITCIQYTDLKDFKEKLKEALQ